MYFVQKKGYIVDRGFLFTLLKQVTPTIRPSRRWKLWRAFITPKTCTICSGRNGRIFSSDDPVNHNIPVHPNCRCRLEPLSAILAGTATQAEEEGVDLYVARFGHLPDNYITQAQAIAEGWDRKLRNLEEILSGRLIGGGIYANRQHLLPDSPGRLWYEADFDYAGGSRNRSRLVFSNDGLIFVTYDHYHTFYELIQEE